MKKSLRMVRYVVNKDQVEAQCLRLYVDNSTQEVIQSDKENQEEASKDTVGAWYTGQCYYEVKNMINQGSMAIRCTAELAKTIQQEGCVKPRLMHLQTGMLTKILLI